MSNRESIRVSQEVVDKAKTGNGGRSSKDFCDAIKTFFDLGVGVDVYDNSNSAKNKSFDKHSDFITWFDVT